MANALDAAGDDRDRRIAELLADNDALRFLLRALVWKAGGRVVVARSEWMEGATRPLEIITGRDADGEEVVYVQVGAELPWRTRAGSN